MSVLNVNSGITTKHIRCIEWTCKDVNTFLFVRPSTVDTMRLIDQGYATKSMDIHDKSSDWGPAAGLVPCDPAFSKALTGSPNNNLHPHDHGDAKAIQLVLTDALADHVTNPKIQNDAGQASTPTVKFVKAKPSEPGTKNTTFKLEKAATGWKVFWMDKANPVPFYVWGYRIGEGVKPVTGDYDLWMVCPHVTRWAQHLQVMGIQDSHGESGATELITWLLDELNKRCGRADNHVFHHGAESQNYGFTQALDTKPLVMFTPTGDSELVELKDLPAVLVDVQNGGYLVYTNKRYGEKDPHLMGNAVNAGVAYSSPRQTAIEALMAEWSRVASHDTPQAVRGGNTNPLSAMFSEPKALGLMKKNLLGRGDEVPKIQQIQSFHKALTAGIAEMEKARRIGFFKKLELNKHIPKASWEAAKGDLEALELQQRLQRAVVELSEMNYGTKTVEVTKKDGTTSKVDRPTPGATLMPSPQKWTEWQTKNKGLLDQLERKFGKGTPTPVRFEQIPGTNAYKATPHSQETNSQTVDRILGPFAGLFNKMFPA